jgi:hypothetical protein
MFVHVPKTGGTSVESSALFADRRSALGRAYVGGHHKLRDLPYASDACRGYHRFAFVRHPCSRLRSLWAYYAENLGNVDDKAWVAAHLSAPARTNFSAFVLEAETPPAAVQAWKWENQVHTQTQVGMLLGEGFTVGVAQVLEMARWQESIDALDRAVNNPDAVARRTAARLALAPLGVTVNLRVNIKSSLQRTHDLASNHSHGHCAQDLTPAAWEALVRMYYLDFCGLGYSALQFRAARAEPDPSDFPPTLQALAPTHINGRLHACRAAAGDDRRKANPRLAGRGKGNSNG